MQNGAALRLMSSTVTTTITMLMIIIMLQLQLQLQLHFKETALRKAWGKTCSNWMTSLMNTGNKTYINMQIAGKYVNTYVHIYTHTHTHVCTHLQKYKTPGVRAHWPRARKKKRATTAVKRTKLSLTLRLSCPPSLWCKRAIVASVSFVWLKLAALFSSVAVCVCVCSFCSVGAWKTIQLWIVNCEC